MIPLPRTQSHKVTKARSSAVKRYVLCPVEPSLPVLLSVPLQQACTGRASQVEGKASNVVPVFYVYGRSQRRRRGHTREKMFCCIPQLLAGRWLVFSFEN
jgi:hypothetical protein